MKISRAVPHICIVLSLMLLTFFVIDRINTAMAFINNDITKWLICALGVCSIVSSIMLAAYQRKD